MDVLILGGTGFLGRHLVEAALGRGHRVTLFNRGIKAPDLFPEVETIEDVLEWDRARPVGTEPAAGLTPEREQELLRAWRGVTL
jgi:nucleoside-diphosphate-sugar epimerase